MLIFCEFNIFEMSLFFREKNSFFSLEWAFEGWIVQESSVCKAIHVGN